MVRSTRPTVTTTAAKILSGGTNFEDETSCVVSNTSAGTIYLGGPDVTTANGFAVAAGSSAALDLGPSDDLWAVAGSSLIVQVIAGRQN